MNWKLWLLATVALSLAWTRPARAGTYLDTAALLLDEARRSTDFLQYHIGDLQLADVAHQLAEARVKCGRTLLVPKDVEKAHPHLLLALEGYERAIAAALENEPERFVKLLLQARDEERTFRAILGLTNFKLPEIERDKK